MAMQPPLWGVVWYWCALVCATVLILQGDGWSVWAVPFLIIVHHGTHEAVHGVLVPSGGKWSGHWKKLAFVSAVLGFGIVGHNFLLLRWSHMFHHAYGRVHRECTIDESDNKRGVAGKIKYYAGLTGLVCLYYELAGYLYLVVPRRWRLLDDGFRPKRYRNKLYLWTQLGVAAITVTLIVLGGTWFIICRAIFMLYWGMTQNVAHYGLEVGKTAHPELISRTYRVNGLWNAALFGAGYFHIEHHAFPKVSGLRLNQLLIREALVAKLGFETRPKYGLTTYMMDVLNQLRGPFAERVSRREWREVG